MSKSKAKGTAAETAVVNYLRDNGFPYAERRALQGVLDKGDVAGIVGVVVEVKNHQAMSLAEWLDEATEERDNASADIGVAWHKRRGRSSPGGWYVTMDGATFVELLKGWLGITVPA